MKCYILLTLGCIILLTACMTETLSPTAPSDLAATTEVGVLPTPPAPDSPLAMPATPQPSSTLPRDMYSGLRDAVAKELDVAPETLQMVHSEEMTWRDSSLGCPEKGMNYSQVIIYGWRIVFEDENGKLHYVHTGENSKNFIICTNPIATKPGLTPIPEGVNMNIAKDAAMDVLMQHLDVERNKISIVSVEVVEWRNSCLGCQRPNQNCLAAITPVSVSH